ncbi:MAG: hypothetical protein KA118_19480 [Verrucomicrobia bacterium]|nr:hypothetical protein [Verrucomicrobiota bacterium]
MVPLLSFGRRCAAPVLFVAAIGVLVAFTEYWMWRQLHRPPAARRRPAPAPHARRAPIPGRGRLRTRAA